MSISVHLTVISKSCHNIQEKEVKFSQQTNGMKLTCRNLNVCPIIESTCIIKLANVDVL